MNLGELIEVTEKNKNCFTEKDCCIGKCEGCKNYVSIDKTVEAYDDILLILKQKHWMEGKGEDLRFDSDSEEFLYNSTEDND